MSVFTPVSTEQLSAWLSQYDLGKLVSYEGISEGVQNTNFFVDTEKGRHVLTLFEQVDRSMLPFYIDLMAHLEKHGIPSPAPRPTRDGRLLGELNGRPAVLISRLSGRSVVAPKAAHCAAVGAVLARLHLAGADFGVTAENLTGAGAVPPRPRGPAWVIATAARVMPFLPAADAELLAAELAWQQRPQQVLPRGVIHADLFRDNVLFDGENGEHVGGLIDFYFSGYGDFLFDLAVVANDWCSEADGKLDLKRTQALREGYESVRLLTDDERTAWNDQLRAAALRFWLSRLEDFHCPHEGEDVTVRNPEVFGRIIRQRILAV